MTDLGRYFRAMAIAQYIRAFGLLIILALLVAGPKVAVWLGVDAEQPNYGSDYSEPGYSSDYE